MARHFYLIAGEASGDALGAKLMRAVLAKEPDARFSGIGGPQMMAAGLVSLFPMGQISHMGFVEVVPHIPKVLRLLKETVQDIRSKKPDMVVTIDAPGFNKRVAAALQADRRAGLKLVHYVAPSVWAYKPQRAQGFAKLYDHLLCLLPFEPPYFLEAGLAASFVGHPVLEEPLNGDGAAFRARHGLGKAPLLLLLPGSRRGELKRHLPIFRATVEVLKHQVPGLHSAVLCSQSMEEMDKGLLAHWPVPLVQFGAEEKADGLAAADVALAKSGTITVELAIAGVPTVMLYRVNPLSMMMIRHMVQVRFANLVNILQGAEIIPEVLQEFCKPSILARELKQLLDEPERCTLQRQLAAQAVYKLRPPGNDSPSKRVAEILLGLLGA